LSVRIKAVARTLLAFEALGKMPAHVYMRLTEVLRLIFSLLPHILICDAGTKTGTDRLANRGSDLRARTAQKAVTMSPAHPGAS
jgi:hypothetical protein